MSRTNDTSVLIELIPQPFTRLVTMPQISSGDNIARSSGDGAIGRAGSLESGSFLPANAESLSIQRDVQSLNQAEANRAAAPYLNDLQIDFGSAPQREERPGQERQRAEDPRTDKDQLAGQKIGDKAPATPGDQPQPPPGDQPQPKPGDKPELKPGEETVKPGEQTFKAGEQPVKPGEQPAQPGDTPAKKPAEGPEEAEPRTKPAKKGGGHRKGGGRKRGGRKGGKRGGGKKGGGKGAGKRHKKGDSPQNKGRENEDEEGEDVEEAEGDSDAPAAPEAPSAG